MLVLVRVAGLGEDVDNFVEDVAGMQPAVHRMVCSTAAGRPFEAVCVFDGAGGSDVGNQATLRAKHSPVNGRLDRRS